MIVGVNKYAGDQQADVEILDIDTSAVRDTQIRRLEKVRAQRDEDACRQALDKLAEAAGKSDNLLAAAVAAARARATVGEISEALEKQWGRHRAVNRSLSGVYGAAYKDDESFQAIRARVERFAEAHGRRPRMLVVKLGQDGHDRGAKVIATAFADIGFDVDIGPLFQTPEEAARQAVENDVHVVGVSSQAAGHKTLVPGMLECLREQNADDILVVCGGVIPSQDYDLLYGKGVAAIFGPGTHIPTAAGDVMSLIENKRDAA